MEYILATYIILYISGTILYIENNAYLQYKEYIPLHKLIIHTSILNLSLFITFLMYQYWIIVFYNWVYTEYTMWKIKKDCK